MKTVNKILGLSLAAGLLFTSCEKDDDAPEVINEEETITTVIVKLTDVMSGNVIELKSFDNDGSDGPNTPEITTGTLTQASTYTAEIILLNELDSDNVEDLTLEVTDEEDDAHQFFYSTTGDVVISELNDDKNGNPLGSSFVLTTNYADFTTLNVKLIHEPKKPNDGTLEDAGGEVEVDITFDLTLDSGIILF